jgi:hypothetical protein
MGKRIASFITQRPRATSLALLGLLAVVVTVIWVEPAFPALIVAATIAAGWCRWLETSAPRAWSSAGCESDSTRTNATPLGVASRGVGPVASRPAEPRDVSLS